ncbi:MAG: NTPase [Lunatimonas sp.]|uniref:NTPase n=1 Tax=Lunatimonas sp. TaxID=2060141 RepID=UPI00263A5CB0|nr:NTPase [Lunatimonas sp.]MCC5936065.1 NTPase [Lunatimonas sp.]
MKYILAFVFTCSAYLLTFAQESPIAGFLDGKSVILISASQAVEPVLTWQDIAIEVHDALVEAGGDPIAYYELEDVTLTEANQRAYAEVFAKRLVKNLVVITRKSNGDFHIHIAPFSQNLTMIRPGQGLSAQAENIASFKSQIRSLTANQTSRNFLVLDVPEFPTPPTGAGGGTATYLAQTPLNLNVFKLGVMLTGVSGDEGFLNTFRQDLLGKSPQQREAEQLAERQGLERIFEEIYPFEVAFLTESRTNQQLIQDRVQFILMRIEGREADIMKNMGVPVPSDRDTNRIVIKFYIKLLVRNELYIGQEWDAAPDWQDALVNFLRQITP